MQSKDSDNLVPQSDRPSFQSVFVILVAFRWISSNIDYGACEYFWVIGLMFLVSHTEMKKDISYDNFPYVWGRPVSQKYYHSTEVSKQDIDGK